MHESRRATHPHEARSNIVTQIDSPAQGSPVEEGLPREARGAVMAEPVKAEGVTKAEATPTSTTRRNANSFIFKVDQGRGKGSSGILLDEG